MQFVGLMSMQSWAYKYAKEKEMEKGGKEDKNMTILANTSRGITGNRFVHGNSYGFLKAK